LGAQNCWERAGERDKQRMAETIKRMSGFRMDGDSNTVIHQAIKKLGFDLLATLLDPDDGADYKRSLL
jgi:hypothetical protein